MADEVTPTAAPEAPAAPAAPVETPAASPVVTPPANSEQQAEDKEWDDAANDLFPGIKGAKKEPKNEPAKPGEDPAATKTPQVDPNETPEQKAERESKEAADEAAKQEAESANSSVRDSRLAARQTAQELKTIQGDVREKMFAEVPKVLQDADGDPIRSIEDVMGLINPRTGAAFTEEEAATWLLGAQQQFTKNLTDMETQINEIAELNLDIKDQADVISNEYGELLKALPQLRTQIWSEFEKTLVKDEKTGIITKAPVSLQGFYKTALEPYAALARKLEADEMDKAATAAQDGTDNAAAQETARRQQRADRSDIYAGGKTDTTDPEDKEWGEAATAVFGPIKK